MQAIQKCLEVARQGPGGSLYACTSRRAGGLADAFFTEDAVLDTDDFLLYSGRISSFIRLSFLGDLRGRVVNSA